MFFAHASSCFFHALPFHALPFTPSRTYSPLRNANAYPPEFTTLTPFFDDQNDLIMIVFFSFTESHFPLYPFPVCLCILLSIVCYRITLLSAPCYPIHISPLPLYPHCSHLIDRFFFFARISLNFSSSFILDFDLFLMFASCLILHPCAIYTYAAPLASLIFCSC